MCLRTICLVEQILYCTGWEVECIFNNFFNLPFWQRGGFALHLDKERVYYGEHVLINLVSIKLILEFLLFQKHAKTTMLS